MSDEPPDYINWDNGRSGPPSLLGCLVSAIGLMIMLTGGVCAWGGFDGSNVAVALIGLLMMAVGWYIVKASR